MSLRPLRLLLLVASLAAAGAACRRQSAPPAPDVAVDRPDSRRTAPAPAASPQGQPAIFARIDETDPAALEVPMQGAKSPLVVIIEAGSYECEHTRKAEPHLRRLLDTMPQVARYYLHNPLPGHKQGYLLAVAASAAQRQGRFWAFHRELIQAETALDEDHLLAAARRAGVDIPMLLADMKRPALKEHVERQRILVAALGLQGTPVFLVNGVPVRGWSGAEHFAKVLEGALERARLVLPDADSTADLHRQLAADHPALRTIMEKGIRWGTGRPTGSADTSR